MTSQDLNQRYYGIKAIEHAPIDTLQIRTWSQHLESRLSSPKSIPVHQKVSVRPQEPSPPCSPKLQPVQSTVQEKNSIPPKAPESDQAAVCPPKQEKVCTPAEEDSPASLPLALAIIPEDKNEPDASEDIIFVPKGMKASTETSELEDNIPQKPMNMIVANQVDSVEKMGYSKFKRNMGMFAPTTPLLLVFAKYSDDQARVKHLMEVMSNRFGKAIFMKAPLEKNMVARHRFNIVDSPVWIAFKNYEPVARVVGNHEKDITELVKTAFNIVEDNMGGEEGIGRFPLFNPF